MKALIIGIISEEYPIPKPIIYVCLLTDWTAVWVLLIVSTSVLTSYNQMLWHKTIT